MHSVYKNLVDIGSRYPILSKSEEYMHFKEVKESGSEQHRDIIYYSNLKLVLGIAMEYRNVAPLEDMILEGTVGLSMAIERFDYKRNIRFSTYATYWIRERILRAIDRYDNTLKLSDSKRDLIRKVNRDAVYKNGEVDYEATSLSVGCSVDVVRDCINSCIFVDTLDKSVNDTNLIDLIADEVGDDSTFKRCITELLDVLTMREKYVIEKRFGLFGNEEMTLLQISRKLGITRERVRQIERKALKKIQNSCDVEFLKNFI